MGRAAVYASLVARGSCAVCDWDESDAYLRVVKESTGGLLRCLPGVWDYSDWAHRYYSRFVILPLFLAFLCESIFAFVSCALNCNVNPVNQIFVS